MSIESSSTSSMSTATEIPGVESIGLKVVLEGVLVWGLGGFRVGWLRGLGVSGIGGCAVCALEFCRL